MRTAAALFWTLALLASIACLPGANHPRAFVQIDGTPRGLFISKNSDAMGVRVIDVETGVSVLPSRQFTKNDKLQLIVESNFEGRLYVVNVELSKTGEKRFLLYPNPTVSENGIKPGDPYRLSVTFDEKAATEILQVIVAHDRIEYLDAAVNPSCSSSENRCQLDSKTAARVSALAGDSKAPRNAEPGGIFPRRANRPQNDSGLVSRDIVLAAGTDKNKDASDTYLAIPAGSADQNRLKRREAFVFEIRLKHI